MIKDIRYNGFTAQPSDYECPDGDLEASVNLINEDGMIKPIMPAQEKFPLEFTWGDYTGVPDGGEPTERTALLDKVLCLHKVGVKTNYLFAMQDGEDDGKWYLLYCLGEPSAGLHLEDIRDIQRVSGESYAPGMSSVLGGHTTIDPVRPVIDTPSLPDTEDDGSGYGDIHEPTLDGGGGDVGEDPEPDTGTVTPRPDIPDPDEDDDEDDEDAGMDGNPDEGSTDEASEGSEASDTTGWGDGTLYYLKTESGEVITLSDILNCEIVGNTVIAVTEKGMNYLLYKPAHDGQGAHYLYLGTHMPEIDIRFALKQHYSMYSYGRWADGDSDTYTKVDFPRVWIPRDYIVGDSGQNTSYLKNTTFDFDVLGRDNINELKNAVKAAANKASARWATKENRFQYPFFLRFAYRLYDGSLAMHSAPILMPANAGPSGWPFPMVRVESYYDDGEGEDDAYIAHVTVEMLTHSIQYMLGRSMEKVSRWKDIIKSVDVFVSAPIYTYDQAGDKMEVDSLNIVKNKQIYSLTQDGAGDLHRYLSFAQSADKHGLPYVSNPTSSDRSPGFNRETAYYKSRWSFGTPHYIKLPAFSAEDVCDKVKNCSNFYLWKSLKVKDLEEKEVGKYEDLTVKEGYMQSLTERETMTDDYFGHCERTADVLHTYNQRLNMAGVRRKAYTNCYFNNFFCYTDGIIAHETTDGNGQVVTDGNDEPILEGVEVGQNIVAVRFYVHIQRDKEIVVRSYQGYMNDKVPVPYFFYPDTEAFKVVFERRDIVKRVKVEDGQVVRDDDDNVIYEITVSPSATFYEIELERHSGLNGAVWFDNYRSALSDTNKIKVASGGTQSGREYIAAMTRYSQGKDLLEELGNKVYTSEVNNPFLFSPKNVTTVGNGRVIGLAAAVRALSQGQFGQFPLYAFTTEGVWSLEVSGTGGFSARQPVTRDVVIGDGRSITSIDSSVLFAADRGIMQLAGSATVCISDDINNLEAKVLGDFNLAPFRDFLKECRMVYDYTNQRVIVYNPAVSGDARLYPYAYVYSLKTHKWGLMQSGLLCSLNSYPDAYAVEGDSVVDLSPETATDGSGNPLQSIQGLLTTRPMKLDNGDVLKTVDTIIQRGYFRQGHIASVLYGSRDLFTWYKVWSSADHYLRGFSGTPYKYFKIELQCNLAPMESLTGCTVRFTPRYTNKPR